MFDEHFHQFIAAASSRATTNTYTSTGFTSFDPNSYSSTTTTSNTTNTQLHSNFLHHPQQQQQAPTQKNIIEAGDTNKQQQQVNRKGENLVEIQSSVVLDHDNDDTSWSSDEVLALLRIRSTLEINNWFPEYTWEHVSRKLLQLGFKRSADRCKEKFEEESSTYFNTNNVPNNYIKVNNFTELDEAAIFEQQPQEININNIQVQKNKPIQQEHVQDKMVEQDSTNINQNPCDEVNINNDDNDNDKQKRSNFYKKRKIREKKFEMFKSFCEDIVHKMMAQQEEMHSKIIEDLVKRDQEKLAREEEWKMKEMERFNKEIEIRAQEQLVACNRQSAIIKFLKSFANSDDHDHLLTTCLDNNGEKSQPLGTNSSSCNSFENYCQTNKNVENLVKVSSPISSPLVSNPNHAGNNIVEKSSSSSSMNPTRQPISSIHHENPNSSALALVPPSQNPNSNNTLLLEKPTQRNPNMSDDIGKRWPRDEVLALINIRSNLYHINGEDKEGGGTTSKSPPLWERISQGMLELGYKRSAKRCKEKWENINKYFRKTKDVNKKRSLDSRTCPYFHQLSTLYNQGTLPLPENHSPMAESGGCGGGGDKLVVADQGEKQSNNGQAQGSEFEL